MKRALYLGLTIVGWLTLAVRLYLRITTSDFSALESTVQFFSYFTILTNLLVTLYCTKQLLNPVPKVGSVFSKPETLTALTVYILIVGAVYHIALKPVWNPEGVMMVLSEIHHTVVPIGALLLWVLSAERRRARLKPLMTWLLYPVAYISFVLFRGSISEFYPYPFLDVTSLGINAVLVNSLMLLLVMVALLLLFHFIGKRVGNISAIG